MLRLKIKKTMSDTSSMSSVSMPSIGEMSNRRGGRGVDSSCLSWIVPLLIIMGIALLFYLWFHFSSCSGSGMGQGNEGTILVVDNMSNNGPKQVIDLTGDQLISLMNSTKGPIVVAFMAGGCGHCTNLKPELHKAGSQSPVQIYSVYAERGMDVMRKFNIGGFPTIVKIQNGKIIDTFKDQRTAQKIVAWAAKN